MILARLTTNAVFGVILAAGVHSTARAGVATFTWNPGAASPALTAGPAAFTADGIAVTNYIRTTNVNDLTTLRQTFSGSQLQTINGFTLGGVSVTAPGLNSSYGLYFHINPAGSFPINASGAVVGPAVYSLLDMQLVADVGHDDGSVVINSTGIGFSNTAGLANDVLLASGSLRSASLAVSPTGTRNAHYLTTFQPVASQAAFFVRPAFPVDWEEFLNSPASTFQVFQLDPLTVVSVVGADGGSTGTAQLVPEPASLALVCSALGGLIMVRRRNAGAWERPGRFPRRSRHGQDTPGVCSAPITAEFSPPAPA